MSHATTFDAIVVGSGITGGWAAKELTERGLKVLMVERGRPIEHRTDYKTETLAPWQLPFHGEGNASLWAQTHAVQRQSGHLDEWTQDYWVNDALNPYQSTRTPEFRWYRGYQLGGRSLMWGRQCYRWSDVDFTANAKDGYGSDWPIRYRDVAPWYDHVEKFIGVSGAPEGLMQLPDGHFQPPMALNAVEAHVRDSLRAKFPERVLTIGRTANLTEGKTDEGRAPCQYRDICSRGCSYGAYFSTQSSTLPAARKTGNLTLITDALVEGIDYNRATRRAAGVRVLEKSGNRTAYTGKLVFLCAGSFNSVALLLRSVSDAFPNGLANSSGMLGRYIMDHGTSLAVAARIPGFETRTYRGNRPTGIVIPRFVNLDNLGERGFVRGYSFQGGAYRSGYSRGFAQPGIGTPLKRELRSPGDWKFVLTTFAECLPRKENRITLDPRGIDSSGAPQLTIEFEHSENERKLLADAKREAAAIIAAAGGQVLFGSDTPNPGGSAIHEMGGARMGKDPADTVVNEHNCAHDVPNLFVTDGSCMASSACQNPSLTYMALTARAAEFASSKLASGAL